MHIKINRITLLCIGLLCTCLMNHAQVIQSEKAYLELKPAERTSTPVFGSVKPEIQIMAPDLNDASRYETSEPEVAILGSVSARSGLQTLTLNSAILQVSDDGQFSKRIDLFPGENTIVVGALDRDRNYTEKRFIVDFVPVKVTLAERTRKESVYYALIIGINNYSDPALVSLTNPIKKENVQVLKDAKREEIIYALDYLSRKVTPDDNVLIFYAGHGNFDKNANIGYWLPSNARKITTADWFGNSQLVDYMKRINSKHTLLITDACFSGSIFTARAAFSDAPKDIEILYDLPSRKAMTSGTLTEVPDNSSFAKYLIDRLENNKQQYYSAEALFSSIRPGVINNSEAVPQYGEVRNVGDQGGDFIFIRK
jgi:hypothetical protein